jgi:hypothetical protein
MVRLLGAATVDVRDPKRRKHRHDGIRMMFHGIESPTTVRVTLLGHHRESLVTKETEMSGDDQLLFPKQAVVGGLRVRLGAWEKVLTSPDGGPLSSHSFYLGGVSP